MEAKILAVADAEWESALRDALKSARGGAVIEWHAAGDAVMILATRPIEYHAVAIEEAAAGGWFDTLLDLTLGDTDKPIPLVILGVAAAQNRLKGTPVLSRPLDLGQWREGLREAAIHSAQHVAPRLPETFSDVESIRIRYQPIIRLPDRRPSGIEILARVQTSEGPLVGPQAIIAAMVDGDYAISLSRVIVLRALREREEGAFDQLGLSFSFNLPLDAMLHPDFLPALERLRVEGGILPEGLRFELTETKPVTDLAGVGRVIGRLRDKGYRVGLDDITPFTLNLDALLGLPFKAMKLDRAVVMGAVSGHRGTAERNKRFIEKIVANAVEMRRAVIAEGIESEGVREAMEALGCSHGQGYLFARPLPAHALRPWLGHWRRELAGPA